MNYLVTKQRTRKKCNIDFSLALAKQFGLSTLCSDFLISKGITDIDSAERYLYPKLSHLYNPFSFKDMQRSVDRINFAIENNQKIFIYGDYDCDGVCASVILYKALMCKNADVEVFIPDRFSDGYGMNKDAVSVLAKKGAELIITVDNGITAIDEIEFAKSLGIDIILSDHHDPLSSVPRPFSLINPKLPSSNYPFEEICGATVALKLAEAIGIDSDKLYKELIIFASIATVADLVPLIDENRTIVSLGLSYISDNLNPGLSELIKISGIKQGEMISASDISFKLAPRINAVGRLENAYYAFDLFTTDDSDRIKQLSILLNEKNEERKKIEEDICAQAENYLMENNLLETQKILFIPIYDGHEGVNGIAAGKIAEKYARPVVVGSFSDSIVKASARSIPGFNIHQALQSAIDLFIKFGGHSQAAGITLSSDNFDKVAEIVNNYAEEMGINRSLTKHVFYDLETVGSFITKESVLQMQGLAPFGIKNPKPVIKFEAAQINAISYLGESRQHVRCNITANGNTFSAIGFSMAEVFSNIEPSKRYDILFTPSINTFRGVSNIQLEIKEIQEHIAVPNDYYVSLYEHFYINNSAPIDYKPQGECVVTESVEEAVKDGCDSVLICYGKDMLIRVVRYCEFKGLKLNVSYGKLEYAEESVNLLVNPLTADLSYIDKEIYVLDIPCFSGYESRFYEDNTNVKFLKGDRYLPSVFIDREYIVFIYKKISALEPLGNDLNKFIRYLNSESILQVNYFLLRICFDILSELGIIDYEIISGKLYVEFNKISGVKDIYSSVVMQKIIKAYS